MSVPISTPVPVAPKKIEENPFANPFSSPFLTTKSKEPSFQGKNQPIPGGFYLNGSIVGKKLFINA
jgi:hypothetical protein